MRARWAVVALAMAVGGTSPAFADKDKGGGGGGGGDKSSSHGSSSSHSSSSDKSNAYDKAKSHPPTTDAQSRHPRPGTGTGDRSFRGDFNGRSYRSSRYRSYGYYGGFYSSYYDPFYYGPFGYGPYGYGYSPFYYGGSMGYGYAPSRYRYRDNGALRVIVDPEKARVYVDGYYAGIADDFDGIFQRLYLPPGRHEIALKLDGYRTHRYRVYVPTDQTIKIHHSMVRGDGEDEEVVGVPDEDRLARRDDRYRRDRDDPADVDDRDGEDRDRREDTRARRDDRRRQEDVAEDEGDNAEAGTLRLDVRPADASVYVDGEFRGSGRNAQHLRLAPGQHRIEVVRPGYRTVERDLDIKPGDARDVAIELARN